MWFVKNDCCGVVSAVLTTGLLLYSQVVITYNTLYKWRGLDIHVVLYTACTALALYSHNRAMFTDPGSVPKRLPTVVHSHDPLQPPLQPRSCKKCKSIKPIKAHHCSTCRRCIIRMDHHCPWVCNCVALFNQKYFLLFLLYTMLCTIYAGSVLVTRFIVCTNQIRYCTVTGVDAALMVVNFVEAIIFGLFVIIMTFDQLAAIFENTPGIDALQQKKGEKRGKYQSLVEVFGEEWSWRWFVPFAPTAALVQQWKMDCDDVIMTHVQPSSYPVPNFSGHSFSTSSSNGDTSPYYDDDSKDASNALLSENRYVFDSDQTVAERQAMRSTDKR